MYYVYVQYLMIMTFPKKNHETVCIRNLLTNTKTKQKTMTLANIAYCYSENECHDFKKMVISKK